MEAQGYSLLYLEQAWLMRVVVAVLGTAVQLVVLVGLKLVEMENQEPQEGLTQLQPIVALAEVVAGTQVSLVEMALMEVRAS
jgi:hypothetical protein